MKQTLLFASLLLSIIGFSQQAKIGCVEIKSNQGGGNCPPCPANPNLANPTATVTITFQNLESLCPDTSVFRLLYVVDANNDTVRIMCGVGQSPDGNFPNSLEYCLYEEAVNTTAGNANNFFNQQTGLELTYLCGTDTLRFSNRADCQILPVKMKSFNANRRNNNVLLIWETATEVNNKGFNVQRNGGGGWQTVAFVNSKVDGGNSNSILSYSYNDVNTSRGVTQYRLQQVDIDGKLAFSDIRTVRGEGLASNLLVYPNPSNSGSVNVVFDDQNSVKDVLVRDISGRLIKQYKEVTNNILVIDNLLNGVYSIQVTDRTTSKSVFEKVIIRRN